MWRTMNLSLLGPNGFVDASVSHLCVQEFCDTQDTLEGRHRRWDSTKQGLPQLNQFTRRSDDTHSARHDFRTDENNCDKSMVDRRRIYTLGKGRKKKKGRKQTPPDGRSAQLGV